MVVGPLGRDTPARRSDQQTVAKEERLVGVFDRRGLLTTGVGQGRESDRLIGELLTEQSQDAPVDLVETELIDPEERESLDGHVLVDPVGTLDRVEVANSSPQTIREARRAARPPPAAP